MAYRGYSGDFYDGPGGLESLVGGFLDSFTANREAKRQRMIEERLLAGREAAAAQAQSERDADRKVASENRLLDLKERGYVPTDSVSGAPDVTISGGPGMQIAPFHVKRFEQVTGTGLSRDLVNNPEAATRRKEIEERFKARDAAQNQQTAAQLVGRLMAATSPEEKAAIYQELAQVSPQTAQGAADSLKPPAPTQKPWEKAGFATEKEWNDSTRRHAAATRGPGGPVGSWTFRDDPKTGKVYRVNATTGQVEEVPGLNAKSGQPSTGETTAAALFTDAQNAVAVLNGDPERGIKPLATPGNVQLAILNRLQAAEDSGKNPVGTNLMLTDATQRYLDASTALAMAFTYATSGKQVNREEARKRARQIIPLPFDGPATRMQKEARRQQWVDTIRLMGGRAVAPDAAPDTVRDPFDDEYDALIGGNQP